jgi:hypothetical protein
MRSNYHPQWLFILSSFLFLNITFETMSQNTKVQDNPILAPQISILPSIDGKEDDPCWQNVPWQSIGETWIPYGVSVDSTDYFGRFKITWASNTNLLYFLVEITDNIFVDGFIPNIPPDAYNFDIIEVFIDENKSGGLHVFDGKDSIGLQWGTNAENAFAYHIYAPFPKEGEITSQCHVRDIVGTNWLDINRVDYASHFPEFALRKIGDKAIWEFSLIVYNDTYEDTMCNKDSARAWLYDGKVIGLTLAYCDNDHPDKNPKVRDKFFGSVHVPVAAYNDHWMNADYFGTIKLVSNIPVKASNHH